MPIDAGNLVTSGITETNYTDCGNVYNRYYAVTAVNENGESAPSNEDRASESCGSAMALTLPVLNATTLTESGEDPVVTKYFFFDGKRVAMDREGVVQWLVGDHLGTTSLVLKADGEVHSEARHYPYGEERWRWPQEGTFPTDYRFTGQRSESGLGLIHMGARLYDSALGRWISADTIVPDSTNPQSYNRYAYVRNSPLNFVDPTGHMEDGECGPDGEQCQDDPPIRDWLQAFLADPDFLAWLAGQVADSWLWDNVPSAYGVYGDLSVTFGCLLEGELNVEASLMFNWRSGEVTFLYGPGAGGYLGSPRGGSISVGSGAKFVYGASENRYLKGWDVYYGGVLEGDAIGELGIEATGSTSLDHEDLNGSGGWDELRELTLQVDPNSNRHINSLQVGATAGVNAVPNGLEGGVVGGVSLTEGFNVISGWDSWYWPWNWW